MARRKGDLSIRDESAWCGRRGANANYSILEIGLGNVKRASHYEYRLGASDWPHDLEKRKRHKYTEGEDRWKTSLPARGYKKDSSTRWSRPQN